MSKHSDYIPKDKYEFGSWANAFSEALAENVDKYGITKEEQDEVAIAAKVYNDDLKAEKALIDQKQVQVKKTNADRSLLVQKSRLVAQVIKANPDYTEEVGRLFDIIGAEQEMDFDTAKPILIAKKVPHGWEFAFGKQDRFTGINVYRKRPGTVRFEYLGTNTRSPFIDKEDMENGTEYYAYYILGDTEVGQASDIVIVGV